MSLDELNEHFRELFSHAPIKTDTTSQFNLFAIAGFRHYEEVVSNCYAFFFQTDNPHGLGSLFLETLCELIAAKGIEPPVFEEGQCTCERERITKNRQFIDLVLYDAQAADESSYLNAIVIENKVYANLYNDLGNYLDDIPLDADGKKVGVVLSLSPILLPAKLKEYYVNITHSEFIGKIQERLGGYLFSAHEKYLMLLKEFLSNLHYLSTPTRMDESVKFYFQNAARITELVSLHKKVENSVVDAVRKEVEKLGFYRAFS